MCTTTFLLVPKKSDGSISRKPRENENFLSQEFKNLTFYTSLPSSARLVFNLKEKDDYLSFCLNLIYNFQNSHLVPFCHYLYTWLNLSHPFHPLSNLVTCVTRVHVVGDFCHITCLSTHFTAPDTRCLEKSTNSDCLGIQLNSTW